jgi:hypothetical protein
MTNKREIMPTTERHTSQVPALVMLAAMGWEILPQAECERLRGRTSRVLLESVLTEQLLKINRYSYRGKEYTFDASDAADGGGSGLRFDHLPAPKGVEPLILSPE